MKSLAALVLVTTAIIILHSGGTDSGTPPAQLPQVVVDSDYYDGGSPSSAKVELGRMLFFDKILSGNRNIACATCHHPDLGTTDGLALGLGEGLRGLGPERRAGSDKAAGVHGRVPRNSPALFNLGAKEFTRLFHDGRVETDPDGLYEGGFITPARWRLPRGLDNVLAAQAMLPVGAPVEMAGQKGENSIADAVSLGNLARSGGVWEELGKRLRDIPEYVELFKSAFPGRVTGAADVNYVLAANAIAAFETSAFRADDSPFDRYQRGEAGALSRNAERGANLFYGRAGCRSCHSGKFQTDHEFHAIGMPQIGPGKSDNGDTDYWAVTGERAFPEDLGRGRVSERPEDDYKFRTPSLRNVAITGPWGHDGAYQTLADVVRHHADPVTALEAYELDGSLLPRLDGVLELTAVGSKLTQSWLNQHRLRAFLMRDDWVQTRTALRGRIAAANELAPLSLSDQDIDDIVAFLESLTDPSAQSLAHLVPRRVPSGLPVAN
jgi:cytochrome c peroxidase